MPRHFAIVLILTGLIGCAPTTTPVTATEAALCRAWGESLPSRSRADTAQTQAEIQLGYADFQNACPGFAGLVPSSAKKD